MLPYKTTLLVWSSVFFLQFVAFFAFPTKAFELWCPGATATSESLHWVQLMSNFWIGFSALFCAVAHATDPAHRRMVLCSILASNPVQLFNMLWYVVPVAPMFKNSLGPVVAFHVVQVITLLLCFPDARNAVVKDNKKSK